MEYIELATKVLSGGLLLAFVVLLIRNFKQLNRAVFNRAVKLIGFAALTTFIGSFFVSVLGQNGVWASYGSALLEVVRQYLIFILSLFVIRSGAAKRTGEQ